MKVTVQKRNPSGEVTYEYEGVLLNQDENSVTLEAFFDRDDRDFMDVVLKKGDRFVEFYYFGHWYNIFAIYDRDDGKIKGWYCNIGMPAVFEDRVVSYVDLALDLWVSVDGEQTVLDEDEFSGLAVDNETRTEALNGLKELQILFKTKNPPR